MPRNQPAAVLVAKHRLLNAICAFAVKAAQLEVSALNIDRPMSEAPWLAAHRYGTGKYDARWYAVMGAKDHFVEGVARAIDVEIDVLIAIIRACEAEPEMRDGD